jgi:molybdopterin-guanine dinucleotide biosynthesis protein A
MRFNAILLAGGRSSRMGRDKAMLILRNTTLLQTSYDKLSQVLASKSDSQVIVSGNYPEYQGIVDEKLTCGPIEGLWSCTRSMKSNSAVLVCPVDMPKLSIEQFVILFEEFEKEYALNPEIQYIQFADWEMPFVFLFNEQSDVILTKVRDSEESAKRSIKYFKSQLQGKSISTQKEVFFANVNTPDDWREVSGETSFKLE